MRFSWQSLKKSTMNYRFLLSLFAVAAPLVAGFGSSDHNSGPSYSHSVRGVDDIVQAAIAGNPQPESNAFVAPAMSNDQPAGIDAAGIDRLRAQLNTVNSDATYQNMRNSDAIAESLAENNLAKNIRTGNINIVPQNRVNQDIYSSFLVPTNRNNHQVIATPPLAPIVVNQPGAPPAEISSGPAAVIKAAPVIYKIRPSVIYQQEVINKIPTPVSLNPVYVKVYKPSRKVEVPQAKIVQPSYAPYSYHNAPYGAADSYNVPSQGSYVQQPDYMPKY